MTRDMTKEIHIKLFNNVYTVTVPNESYDFIEKLLNNIECEAAKGSPGRIANGMKNNTGAVLSAVVTTLLRLNEHNIKINNKIHKIDREISSICDELKRNDIC